MSRVLTLAAGQLGPIARNESRSAVVNRMMALMREAKSRGVDLIVYPELALTTFFPRWWIEDEEELDQFYEKEMPSNETKPLFDLAAELSMGFHLGYGEQYIDEAGRKRRFNTAILVNRSGRIVGKYRKVHLPGHDSYEPERAWQHLEKAYFEVGDLGFPVFRTMDAVMGMCICNDRRWPETWRVLGMQSAELVVLGYNTPTANTVASESPHLRMFHNHISMQAGAYQNGTWVVGTAKAGIEEGVDMMAGSCVVAPTGEIVALASSNGDEVITARADLERGRYIRETIFNFKQHRRIEHYGLITERTEPLPPPAKDEDA